MYLAVVHMIGSANTSIDEKEITYSMILFINLKLLCNIVLNAGQERVIKGDSECRCDLKSSIIHCTTHKNFMVYHKASNAKKAMFIQA